MRAIRKRLNKRGGFSLVELAVVIVIIGVLAAFAVPKFRDAVERSKAAEAFNYLSAVRAAQEQYQARKGTYASSLSQLDVKMPAPKYFSVGRIRPGRTGSLENSWRLTLTRRGAAAGYGRYTVTFTEDGYSPRYSSIQRLPQINPME